MAHQRMITILDGSTFCSSDENGQIAGGVSGLVADDTRFLSRLELRLDGRLPLPLGGETVEYFNAAFYCRNAATAVLPRDTVSIARERFIGRGLAERLTIRNEGAESVRFDVGLELEADFVDIITLKAHEFALEAGETDVPSLPAPQVPVARGARELVLDDPESELVTWIVGSRDLPLHDGQVVFGLDLTPGEEWELVFEVIPGHNDVPRGTSAVEMRFGRERRQVRRALSAFGFEIPTLQAARPVEDVYYRSIADLASLRLRGFGSEGTLPAAGMPWFMTVFGRDTLITSLQTLLFGPELAIGALRSLASLQATADAPEADAEPGKIPHEVRRGKAAATWFPIYFGSVDATPLYLVLLSEVWRWTGDAALVEELWEPAMRALEWIDEHGDRDGDGFVEYERRTPRGLENQSWKDSGDSQRFRDGRHARTPIAPVEVQGYVYDAKRRMAELTRVVRRDPVHAERLEGDAADLARRFDEHFWMEERGAYALALDADKAQVDTLCSNIGHLLWSGIVPQERKARLARHLTEGPLWSGWGVRTMAADETPYNPISYHNGTVWPHDTSLAAWGLLEAGFPDACHQLCEALLDAADSLGGTLPEVFAGFERDSTPFVVSYPTASRPQAWAAGAPVLALQLLLGLRPDQEGDRLRSIVDAAPPWLGDVTLTGIRARGRRWVATIRDAEIGVDELQ